MVYRNEYGDGYEDARAEVRRDGWTLDMARQYLAAVGESTGLYGRGFDAYVRAFVALHGAREALAVGASS